MIDYSDLLEQVTDEIVIAIMEENGSPLYRTSRDTRTQQECLWFRTICHDGDSSKLCYFTQTKDFYCYTNCGRMTFFDFIKKIKIPETAGASYQDFPFMAEVLCKAKRVSVVKRPFVHWRNDEGQGNSTSARGKKLLLMAKNSKTAIDILKKYKKFDIFKEPFFVHVLWTNYEFFNRIEWKYKKEYFNELVDIFSEIKDDSTFHFAYFSTFENNSVRYFLEKNGYKKYLYRKFRHELKQKIIKTATIFFPTYRMARFLKDQNFDLMHQNELLMDEVLALRREVEKLKK